MLRSLLAGVSGLRNHQMKMDVLGNNIANINTVGYKGGRINFSEALSQTISKAVPSTGNGYINPMQVGLGMKTSSIETLFAQGSLESTGNITDMAIEGEGFFVLRGGNNRLFTRAGQFYFNADGKLVNQRGLSVQGWMLNSENMQLGLGSGNMTDIIIDENLVSEAKTTQNVSLTGNLNAGLETTAEVWSLGTALTAGGSNADATTLINDMDQVATPLVAGDTIEIAGSNPDGTAVGATYTYTAGDTLQELLDVINASFSGATATLTDGKIVLTDDVAGDSSTTINLSNGAANTGTIDLPNFINTNPGTTGTARTSVVVYDSLGGSHNLIMEFTKTTTDGVWTWEASTSGDETIVSGGSGRATFDSAGLLTSFTFNDGVSGITMEPDNGSETLQFNLLADGGDDYTGLSQFESLSTLGVREQDGRSTGELLGITIGRDGVISGSFSNGQIDPIAQLALAQFPNYGGLGDLGDGLYQTSIASGSEQILSLTESSASAIVSGALEMSNVDLSKEFTEMITAQRGFQANAKVITTADQLLNELVNLKR